MTWFLLSLLGVAALAAAELLQHRLLNKENPIHERVSGIFSFVVQAILAIPFLIFLPEGREIFSVFKPQILPQVLLVSAIASISMIFYLKSFKVKNISISTIFGSVSVLVSTFLGIVFFNESIGILKFAGIFLILGAIVMLNYKNASLEKSHFFALLSGVLFGCCYVLDKSIVLAISPLVYTFWSFLLIGVFGFLFSPRQVIREMKGKSLSAYKLVIISGTSYFIYNIANFYAYRFGGEVGKVDAINNSQVFLIILFEYYILRHKASLRRKLFTAFIAYLGVALLGLF